MHAKKLRLALDKAKRNKRNQQDESKKNSLFKLLNTPFTYPPIQSSLNFNQNFFKNIRSNQPDVLVKVNTEPKALGLNTTKLGDKRNIKGEKQAVSSNV